MIENRDALQEGVKLVARYRKEECRAVVEQGDKGIQILIQQAPNTEIVGRPYPTVSAAAMAITGNSVNGWRFWSVEAADVPHVRANSGRKRKDQASDTTPKPRARRKAAQPVPEGEGPVEELDSDGRPTGRVIGSDVDDYPADDQPMPGVDDVDPWTGEEKVDEA